MCKVCKTGYTNCMKQGNRRGEDGKQFCIDEELVRCKIDGPPCPKPKVFSRWLSYKCPEHGGPSHEERTKMIKKDKGAGTHIEVREAKTGRRSQWHGTICVVL